jgi:hypothetical protein
MEVSAEARGAGAHVVEEELGMALDGYAGVGGSARC